MQLEWCDPIEFARNYAAYDSLVFLHSSLAHADYGTLSILAVNEKQRLTGEWEELAHALPPANSEAPWNERWFGFMGYELGAPSTQPPSSIALPALWFAQYKTVFIFDHQQKTLHRYGEDAPLKPAAPSKQEAAVKMLSSNMSKAQYLNIIEQTLEQIAAGEFYQANITRKFFGEFSHSPDSFSLFCKLCDISPACYSAYLKVDGVAILSSSPECFLTLNADGTVESRPIKGTAPRSSNPQELANSTKDRAENLMIVDLMRNDLSHHCEAGSVQTHKLFEVTSYATLHHMASTITGKRRADSTSLELIRACFPPGSMTGAPKKAVMQWCEVQERQQRGLYSGAIGWLAATGEADLSVVIRTLMIKDNLFEFQVGGGIVADSQPLSEWRETMTKAKGILASLNLSPEALKKL